MGAAPMIAAMGLQVYGGINAANAEREAGNRESDYYKYLAGTSRINADLAEARAESDVTAVGAEQMDQVGQIHTRERETIGTQKAALVSGAGVGSKTAEQIITDTTHKTDLDEMALRYNADLKMKNLRLGAKAEGMNLESEAAGYEMAGKNAKLAAKKKAEATLLGTAASTGFNIYSMR